MRALYQGVFPYRSTGMGAQTLTPKKMYKKAIDLLKKNRKQATKYRHWNKGFYETATSPTGISFPNIKIFALNINNDRKVDLSFFSIFEVFLFAKYFSNNLDPTSSASVVQMACPQKTWVQNCIKEIIATFFGGKRNRRKFYLNKSLFNLFLASSSFLYSLKASEYLWYRKEYFWGITSGISRAEK